MRNCVRRTDLDHASDRVREALDWTDDGYTVDESAITAVENGRLGVRDAVVV